MWKGRSGAAAARRRKEKRNEEENEEEIMKWNNVSLSSLLCLSMKVCLFSLALVCNVCVCV
jgi:hypothetical protein